MRVLVTMVYGYVGVFPAAGGRPQSVNATRFMGAEDEVSDELPNAISSLLDEMESSGKKALTTEIEASNLCPADQAELAGLLHIISHSWQVIP